MTNNLGPLTSGTSGPSIARRVRADHNRQSRGVVHRLNAARAAADVDLKPACAGTSRARVTAGPVPEARALGPAHRSRGASADLI